MRATWDPREPGQQRKAGERPERPISLYEIHSTNCFSHPGEPTFFRFFPSKFPQLVCMCVCACVCVFVGRMCALLRSYSIFLVSLASAIFRSILYDSRNVALAPCLHPHLVSSSLFISCLSVRRAVPIFSPNHPRSLLSRSDPAGSHSIAGYVHYPRKLCIYIAIYMYVYMNSIL